MGQRKRRLVVIFVLGLCAAVGLAAGCGGGSNPALQGEGGNEVSAVAGDGQEQVRQVKDDLGFEVEIAGQPRRVLVLNSAMTEMVLELGIVPVGKVSEYIIPRPEVQDLPEISLENSPNIEMINKLAPDLIIAHASNHGQIRDSLVATGAAVFYVDPGQAEDQLLGRIDLLGVVLNRQAEAAAYVQRVWEKSEELQGKLAKSPVRTALLVQGGSQTVRAAQTFCFWGRLLSFLGLENIVPEEVAKTTGAGFVNFDIETVLQKDPDALFILQPGFRSAPGGGKEGGGGTKGSPVPPGNGGVGVRQEGGTKQGELAGGLQPETSGKNADSGELLAMYRNDPMWQQLSAVKNDRLYIVPDRVSPGRIGVLDALEVMAKLLVPEEF